MRGVRGGNLTARWHEAIGWREAMGRHNTRAVEPWGGDFNTRAAGTQHTQDTWVEGGDAMPRIMGGGLLLACWVLVQCWCSAGAVRE